MKAFFAIKRWGIDADFKIGQIVQYAGVLYYYPGAGCGGTSFRAGSLTSTA